MARVALRWKGPSVRIEAEEELDVLVFVRVIVVIVVAGEYSRPVCK